MLTSDSEASIPQDNLDTPRRRTLEINEKENKTDKICDSHKYVQSLATEREGIKLFNKEKFYLLAQLVSEINSNTDTTDNTVTETTDLLYKQNEFFLQKNKSKNTIIKFLAKNRQQRNNIKKVNSYESFKTVKVLS